MARVNPFTFEGEVPNKNKNPYMYSGPLLYHTACHKPFGFTGAYACVAPNRDDLTSRGNTRLNIAIQDKTDARFISSACGMLVRFFNMFLSHLDLKVTIGVENITGHVWHGGMSDTYCTSRAIPGVCVKAPSNLTLGHLSFDIQVYRKQDGGFFTPVKLTPSSASRIICKFIRQLSIFGAYMRWMTNDCHEDNLEIFMRKFFTTYNQHYPQADHNGHWIEEPFNQCYFTDDINTLCTKLAKSITEHPQSSSGALGGVV